MATVRTGGSLAQKAGLVLVFLIVTPYAVDQFWVWLAPKLPALLTLTFVLLVLMALVLFFIRRARRNAAR